MCILIGSFCPKYKTFDLKNLSYMTLKSDAKFEEKLTCHFKIFMRNLTNFDPTTKKSQKFAL